MTDIHLRSVLHRKCAEIEARIGDYQSRLSDAQSDLVHLRATIALFEREGKAGPVRSEQSLSVSHLYKRGELAALCELALQNAGRDLTTTQLAEACLKAKGQDPDDKLLARSVAQAVGLIMKALEGRGVVRSPGKKGVVRIWRRIEEEFKRTAA